MPSDQSGLAFEAPTIRAEGSATPDFEMIELLFFAYRDFVGDADRLLDAYGFGRAHHRVLHFVQRRPGMTVAELLVILRITKQSLNRVMNDLLDAGFIAVRSGASDRRQRRLFVSEQGGALALKLAQVQSARFGRILQSMDGQARATVATFLLGMIDPGDRGQVAVPFPRRTGVDDEGPVHD